MSIRRKSTETNAESPVEHKTVRVLRTPEELRVAVERAREGEMRSLSHSQRRVSGYDHYLGGSESGVADVLHIDGGTAS